MAPVLTKNKSAKPLRFAVHQGAVLIMDGPSRMEWSHGLPYNVPFTKTKYTIMFKCDKFAEHDGVHNNALGTQITSSGKVC